MCIGRVFFFSRERRGLAVGGFHSPVSDLVLGLVDLSFPVAASRP